MSLSDHMNQGTDDLSANRPKEPTTPEAPIGQPVTTADAEDVVTNDPKARAAFFVAVRQRGLVNAMLEQMESIARRKFPGYATRWEFAPPNGDDAMVTAREAQGFRVVHNSDLGEGRRTGPVRRGDLILMIGPKELVAELASMDARAALEDLKAPEEAFRSSLESRKVTTKVGTEEHAKPFGEIKQTTEVRTAFTGKDGGIHIGPTQE